MHAITQNHTQDHIHGEVIAPILNLTFNCPLVGKHAINTISTINAHNKRVLLVTQIRKENSRLSLQKTRVIEASAAHLLLQQHG